MSDHPTLTVDPSAALFDQDVQIKASGLPPGATATIRATFRDEEGLDWASEAQFTVPENGVIDTAHCPVTGGTYDGIDPMGLFWSMRPLIDGAMPSREDFLAFIKDSASAFVQMGRPALSTLDPLPITISLRMDGAEIASKMFSQLRIAPGVEIHSLLDEGLAANVYTPPGKPRGGIITITGSNGGYETAHAPLLASHGYLTMSLALFAAEGVPQHMIELPIEYMEKALDWMAGELGHTRIGMIGWSKGAESVLMAASFLGDKVGVVASCLPCHVIMNGTDGTTYDHVGWTWRGEPLPYHLLATPEEAMQAMQEMNYTPGKPLSLRPAFELGYKRVKPEALIPIENAACPVLLLSGGDDQNWPSSDSARIMVDKLREADPAYPVTHLDYPDAGHLISAPNAIKSASDVVVHPIRKEFILCGGTPAANAQASHDSWPKILAFFDDALSA